MDERQNQIVVSSVTKDYDVNTRALNCADLTIKKGEWVSIMGPSGSGKTTLLNILSCLDKPTSGTVQINGTNITALGQKMLTKFRRENIGLIFQQYHLIPYLTALENVMVAGYFYGIFDEKDATEALVRVGLDHRLNHLPSQLSGGEQQRVCIARALYNDPEILIADEPTGNLDQKNGEVVMKFVGKLHDEGHTIVLVTHNIDIAKLGERTIKLVDGKII
jgi:putative ABC transport system ATP-binding protein